MNTGSIETRDTGVWGYAGGIIGYQWSNDVTITNCYNSGEITSINSFSAGISPALRSTKSVIQNCYNVGTLKGKSKGGIVCLYEKGSITNNYWLSDCGAAYGRYSTSSNTGAMKKTSEEMQELASALGDAYAIDKQGINNGYPILNWQVN